MKRKFSIVQTIIIVTLFMLQFIVAPAISIDSIVPNFILTYLVLFSICKPGKSSLVLAFFCSLLYSIIFRAPVGVFSLVIVVTVFIICKIRLSVSTESIVFKLFLAIFSILAIELVYGTLMLLFGFQTDFFVSIFLIALPSFVYDLILFLILLPIISFLVNPASPEVTESQSVDIV